MWLTGKEVTKQVENGKINISQFSTGKINPNSYNYTLFNKIYRIKNEIIDFKIPDELEELTIGEEGLVLQPGECYLGCTNEVFGSNHFASLVTGRSSIGRKFVTNHVTAALIDQGFQGRITLEITVTKPTRVYADVEFGQIYWFKTMGEALLYQGKYQFQRRPMPSLIHVDFLSKEELKHNQELIRRFKMNNKKTVILNLFGSNRIKKSLTMSKLYLALKGLGYSVETVQESSKEFLFQKGHIELLDQLDIISSLTKKEKRYYENVDFVIMESPILVSPFWEKHFTGYETTWSIADQFTRIAANEYNIEYINLFLRLNKVSKSNLSSRNDISEDDVKSIHKKLQNWMHEKEIAYHFIDAKDDDRVDVILNHLSELKIVETKIKIPESDKAIFIDLDGTLIHKKEDGKSIDGADEVRLNKNISGLVKKYVKEGYRPIVISNKSRFDKNTDKKRVDDILDKTKALLGLDFEAYIAFKGDIDNIKPAPGMFKSAIKDFSLNPSFCLMIGDAEKDRLAASKAGVPYIDITDLEFSSTKNTVLKLCFIAPTGFGKSTAANYLKKAYDADVIKLAKPLYELQEHLFDFLGKGIDGQDGELLQFLGNKVQTESPLFLFEKFQEEVKNSNSMFIVNDDCRPHNYKYLKNDGFLFIKIDGKERKRETDNTKVDPNHDVEKGADIQFDHVIENKKSIKEFENKLDELYKIVNK